MAARHPEVGRRMLLRLLSHLLRGCGIRQVGCRRHRRLRCLHRLLRRKSRAIPTPTRNLRTPPSDVTSSPPLNPPSNEEALTGGGASALRSGHVHDNGDKLISVPIIDKIGT